MNVGIIGAGAIVSNFFQFASEVEGMSLKAICATPPEEEKILEMCKANNIPSAYTDVDVMLKDDTIDTIYVAVPNHLHYLFCKKALEAGKHVICEKPFTSNYKEAKELVELTKTKNLFLFEAVSTRYIPNALKIKEMLPQLGNIKILSMSYSQYSSRYDAFKAGEVLPAFNPEMSGGALMDLNIYNINFAVTLFGAPKHINYEANIERGIDTSGVLTLDYGSFKCVSVAAKDCKAPISTSIQGDEGCILIPSSLNVIANYKLLMNKADAKQMSADGGEEFDYNEGKHRMYPEFVEFVRMINENDIDKMNEMLEVSLITMQIQTEARKTAGVVFAADK